MSDTEKRSLYTKEYSEPYEKKPLDVSGYTEVYLRRPIDAQWQRPAWPLELRGLRDNQVIDFLLIEIPCSVSLDLENCVRLNSLDLSGCNLNSPLKLGPKQRYLQLRDCELSGILQTQELISLELKSTIIGSPVTLPDSMERLELNCSTVELECLPKRIEYFKYFGTDSSRTDPILDVLLVDHAIEIEGLCHISNARLSKAISFQKPCGNLSIWKCQMEPEFKLGGHFRYGDFEGGEENYFFGHAQEGLFFEELGATDWYTPDAVLELAQISRTLTVGLDGDFPDLSKTQLESMTLSSWRNSENKSL